MLRNYLNGRKLGFNRHWRPALGHHQNVRVAAGIVREGLRVLRKYPAAPHHLAKHLPQRVVHARFCLERHILNLYVLTLRGFAPLLAYCSCTLTPCFSTGCSAPGIISAFSGSSGSGVRCSSGYQTAPDSTAAAAWSFLTLATAARAGFPVS